MGHDYNSTWVEASGSLDSKPGHLPNELHYAVRPCCSWQKSPQSVGWCVDHAAQLMGVFAQIVDTPVLILDHRTHLLDYLAWICHTQWKTQSGDLEGCETLTALLGVK